MTIIQDEWIDIASAPKDWDHPILTYRTAGFQSVAAWIDDEHGWCCTDGVGLVDVTHWMPLPKPPQTNPDALKVVKEGEGG